MDDKIGVAICIALLCKQLWLNGYEGTSSIEKGDM